MRITAVLSPTSLCYLSVSGAVWSVLVVLCAAKHVKNNPTALDSDLPVSQNNSEDCNDIPCNFEDRAQPRGQDDIPSRKGSPKQAFEFEMKNENEEQGKHSADEPVVNDVQVCVAVDYEEDRKIASDMTKWNNSHLPRQMHGKSLCRRQNLQSGDLQQSCEGKQYLECQCQPLYFEIQAAMDHLSDLQEAYARYARHTTWDAAARQVAHQVNVAALPPPMRHLMPAIEVAKSCGSFPVLETNRENKANISEGSDEYNNSENFVCLMSSTYEIVTVLTWLLDIVQLDLAIGPDMDGIKSEVLENLIENSSPDSPTLSACLSMIRRITLSEMKCRNRKPNNDVLVEILQSKLEDIGGPDHAVRGLQVILLLEKFVSTLSQL